MDRKNLDDLDYWMRAGQAGYGQGQPISIPPDGRMDVLIPAKSGPLTVLATMRSGETVSVALNEGTPCSFDGRVFANVVLTSVAAFAIVPLDALPTWGAVGTPHPLGTPIDGQQAGPQNLATGSAEAVITAGANVVNGRARLQWVGAAWTIGSETSPQAYVALKGHTSGIYYAVVLAGLGISGEMDLGTGNYAAGINSWFAAEKLDIVAANESGKGMWYHFAWQATTP